MVICVLLPRFEISVAAGGRDALLALGPAALAPEPGREQLVGEISAAAAVAGVHAGMRLGEALARCPSLALVPPDPVGVADAWEGVLGRLEGVGAAVESPRPGMACFEGRGLRRLYGGRLRDDPVWLDAVVGAVRRALAIPARIGAGPSRFCALAGASRARSRRAEVMPGAAALAPRTGRVSCVAATRRRRWSSRSSSSGSLDAGRGGRARPRAAMSDRFGAAGLRAHELAQRP